MLRHIGQPLARGHMRSPYPFRGRERTEIAAPTSDHSQGQQQQMTQAVELPISSTRAGEQRLVFGVCVAHFSSHYFMLLIAPLFLFIRADYDVTYTELGLALTVFAVASALLQTPVGFLVDRIGARVNL